MMDAPILTGEGAYRICPSCQEAKPLNTEHFHRSGKSYDGFRLTCRTCKPLYSVNEVLDDKLGKRFGRLIVVSYAGKRNNKAHWVCRCDCGREKTVAGCHLANKHTVSCGCYKSDLHRTHGRSGSAEYRLLIAARQRARDRGLPFDLDIQDIVIPDRCPILGIPIEKTDYSLTAAAVEARKKNAASNRPLKNKWNSPSIDQIIPGKGYTKNNFWIISFRANLIKNDSTPNELRTIANAVELKIAEVGVLSLTA